MASSIPNADVRRHCRPLPRTGDTCQGDTAQRQTGAARGFRPAPFGSQARPVRSLCMRPLFALTALGVVYELFIGAVVVRPASLLPNAAYATRGFPLSSDIEGLTRFAVVAGVAFALYLSAYVLVLQCRGRAVLALVLGFSAVFSLTLLLARPMASPDVFSNIIDGRMAWIYGLNPITIPRTAAAFDPLYSAQSLMNRGFMSPYGPFWQLLLWIPTRLA